MHDRIEHSLPKSEEKSLTVELPNKVMTVLNTSCSVRKMVEAIIVSNNVTSTYLTDAPLQL